MSTLLLKDALAQDYLIHQTIHRDIQAWSSSTVDSRPTLIRLSPGYAFSSSLFLSAVLGGVFRQDMLLGLEHFTVFSSQEKAKFCVFRSAIAQKSKQLSPSMTRKP